MQGGAAELWTALRQSKEYEKSLPNEVDYRAWLAAWFVEHDGCHRCFLEMPYPGRSTRPSNYVLPFHTVGRVWGSRLPHHGSIRSVLPWGQLTQAVEECMTAEQHGLSRLLGEVSRCVTCVYSTHSRIPARRGGQPRPFCGMLVEACWCMWFEWTGHSRCTPTEGMISIQKYEPFKTPTARKSQTSAVPAPWLNLGQVSLPTWNMLSGSAR